jgi:hypothetical protein
MATPEEEAKEIYAEAKRIYAARKAAARSGTPRAPASGSGSRGPGRGRKPLELPPEIAKRLAEKEQARGGAGRRSPSSCRWAA